MRHALVALLIIALAVPAAAAKTRRDHNRDPRVAREFQRHNPCPATGRTSGACPGYVRDHIIPLACGGPDRVANLQWQTTAEAKAKDRVERKCRVGMSPPGTGSVIILRGH
jgi:hypothetical protein